MQNFIGIGIANSAYDAGISKRPLECTVLSRECTAKRIQVARKNLDASRINVAQTLFSGKDIQRRTPLCACFGKDQRAGGEIECSEIISSSQLRTRSLPMKPSRNHQVQNQPEIVIESDSNAFTDAPQLTHCMAFHIFYRGVRRAQQKGARNPNMLQRLSDNARLQRADIGSNVRQLRHEYQLALLASDSATSFAKRIDCPSKPSASRKLLNPTPASRKS